MLNSDIKLEGQARFTVHRRRNQNIPNLVGEANGHRHSIISAGLNSNQGDR